MWRLVRAAVRRLHWWWRGDRIRVAPGEGRLLGIRPPCFLRIGDDAFEVVSRQAEPGGVRYHCVGAGGACELIVRLVGGNGEARVRRDGADRVLDEDEVEVIPARPGVPCSRRYNC